MKSDKQISIILLLDPAPAPAERDQTSNKHSSLIEILSRGRSGMFLIWNGNIYVAAFLIPIVGCEIVNNNEM